MCDKNDAGEDGLVLFNNRLHFTTKLQEEVEFMKIEKKYEGSLAFQANIKTMCSLRYQL